ncbi:hypothetical protein FB451DRAFT_1411144 [Mycena latifolia]|nr:hypothetical protein FB451DRAFT_1411144 [Mycena latifolia]
MHKNKGKLQCLRPIGPHTGVDSPFRAFRVYSLSLAVLYRIYPAAGHTYPGLQCGAHARDLGTAANIALDVITCIDQVVGDLPPQAVSPPLGLGFRIPAHHAICISVSVFISGYLVIHGTRFALSLVAHSLILFFLLFYMPWFASAAADVSINLEF